MWVNIIGCFFISVVVVFEIVCEWNYMLEIVGCFVEGIEFEYGFFVCKCGFIL